MGLFDKIKKGLQKTSDAVSRSLDAVFAGFVTIDDDLLEELEELEEPSSPPLGVGSGAAVWPWPSHTSGRLLFL